MVAICDKGGGEFGEEDGSFWEGDTSFCGMVLVIKTYGNDLPRPGQR
jgi:hypothetical protein